MIETNIVRNTELFSLSAVGLRSRQQCRCFDWKWTHIETAWSAMHRWKDSRFHCGRYNYLTIRGDRNSLTRMTNNKANEDLKIFLHMCSTRMRLWMKRTVDFNRDVFEAVWVNMFDKSVAPFTSPLVLLTRFWARCRVSIRRRFRWFDSDA